MNDYQEQKGISDFDADAYGHRRGTPPHWDDLTLDQRDQWVRDNPYCHACGDDLDPDDIEMGHRWCKVCAEKPVEEEPK